MSTTLDPSARSGSRHDPGTGSPTRPRGPGWVLAGVGAGAAGIVSMVASSLVDAVYDPATSGDADAIAEAMSNQVAQVLVFHTATMLSCALLVVFTAGLHRQLRHRTGPDSLVPGVAAIGLVLVAVAQLMGAGLTTEFAFAFAAPDDAFVPETVAFFGHWVGTVPWLWGAAGLTGLAVAAATFRQGAYPRWIGWVSIVLGGLTAVFLVSPAQYMAGMTGPVWLLVVSLGLLRTAREA
ncbi:hypothetical protein [Nocardioides renjunii]|uniref:hypothetical protein n=1 Tax=Nocardioides renjunii TaxID=3095075 RepID=UPI002AFF8BE3|nr:hypothetical protein [Nocardioides sp. S-34]WQQ23202.1 hypothetical protein SHK17_04310 [Nocardioides sp. S-34]